MGARRPGKRECSRRAAEPSSGGRPPQQPRPGTRDGPAPRCGRVSADEACEAPRGRGTLPGAATLGTGRPRAPPAGGPGSRPERDLDPGRPRPEPPASRGGRGGAEPDGRKRPRALFPRSAGRPEPPKRMSHRAASGGRRSSRGRRFVRPARAGRSPASGLRR